MFFKGDVLERFEGDPMPSEAEFVATLDNKRKDAKVPVLEASEEQPASSSRPAVRPPRRAAGARSQPAARRQLSAAGSAGRADRASWP